MSWQYWVSVLPFALLGASVLGVTYLRDARRKARDWAAAGLRYGNVWPMVIINVALGAACGYAVGNFIAQAWL